MYCKHCGTEISIEALYCPHCGKLIVKENTSLTQTKTNKELSSDVSFKDKETCEEGKDSNISQYIGRMCVYVIFCVIILGILAAIRMLSKELFGDYVLYYCAITGLGSIALIKFYKWFKTFSKEAKYFTFAILFIIFASKIGYDYSSYIAERRLINNGPKPLTEIQQEEAAINYINTKLPIDIDEKISWVKSEFKTDSIYFEYLTDDSSLNYEMQDLDNYQKLFISNLIMVSNKTYVEHLVNMKLQLKFRIISVLDYSKHVDMSLKGIELEYVLKQVESN